jgi:SAM-dependent methyltransferase
VRDGWNRVSELYRADDASHDVFGHAAGERAAWLRPLLDGVPAGARVLDLGCGCGVPDGALLAERFRVTGVDISDRQIVRARRLLPNASFRRADMARVDFPSGTFGGIVCLYALIHLPLGEQRALLGRIRRWLTPAGWLVLIAGHEAFEGIEENWLGSGVAMYWSHADGATYRRWLDELGFEIVAQRLVPEGNQGHELFQAKVRDVRFRSAGATRTEGPT